jgi:FSR family fosmidomycin resistance protein-like MFS transporter
MTPVGTSASSSKVDGRNALVVACGAHALHDGYTDMIYVLLPIWQGVFALDYGSVGILRALSTGTMAAMQVPAGSIARLAGGTAVLVAGTAILGVAYILAGFSGGLITLALALALAGIGLSTQHPIASSLVAQAYEGQGVRIALGIYNFAGDIGKMIVPAAMAVLVVSLTWRPAISIVGIVGVAAAALIAVRLRALHPVIEKASGRSQAQPSAVKWGFGVLLAIGIIDSATRMAFLTFLPFLLRSKGGEVATIGIALSLIFAGGAAGKFVCGFLGARLGVLKTIYFTEGLTALSILALLPLPLSAELVLLPIIGLALNGTSSVLYGTVPEFAPADRRERAFGLFYTGTIGAGALSPILCGFIGNAVGVSLMLALIASAVLTTIPVAFQLRSALRAA